MSRRKVRGNWREMLKRNIARETQCTNKEYDETTEEYKKDRSITTSH